MGKRQITRIIYEEISQNFKKVIIKNIANKSILSMNKNGEVFFELCRGEETCKYIWYITIINDEIPREFEANHITVTIRYLSLLLILTMTLGLSYSYVKLNKK